MVWLKPEVGISFNGSGNELIDEDFDPDPSWTSSGQAEVTGGEAVFSPLTPGVGDSLTKTFVSQTDVWCQFDITFNDIEIITTGHRIFGTGFNDNATSNDRLMLGAILNAGVVKFTTSHKTDSANVLTIHSEITMGKKYNIVIHYVAATAPAANDGVAEVWIDQVKVLDLSNLDSDTISIDQFLAGSNLNSTTVSGGITVDNVKVGTTGASPLQVTNWADSSGNGNDVLQATSANQPTYNVTDSNLNNQPSLTFDGITQLLRSANYAAALVQPNEIFVVYKYADNIGQQMLVDGTTGGRNAIFTDTAQSRIFAGTIISSHTEDTNPHILEALFNGASSDTWRDGTQTTPVGDIGAQSMTGITLGAANTDVSLYAGEISEVLVFNRALDGPERNVVTSYLSAKYGIAWV
jgi:hypothetical protein